MRNEIAYDKFNKIHGDKCINAGYEVEDVYEYYHEHIYPYLPLIARYRDERNVEIYADLETIRFSLYINKGYWKICRKVFKGLITALNGKATRMDLMVQGVLVKELQTNPNAKYVDMGMLRYDEGYKPKGDKTELAIPKTISFEVRQARLPDEEFEKRTPQLKQNK